MTIGGIFLSKSAQKAGFAPKNLDIEVENFGIAPKILDRVEIMILY